jgi:hypothetical protein
MTATQAKVLLPAAAGVVAALFGIPTVAAAMLVSAPLGFVPLAVGVAILGRLHRSANANERRIVRNAWKASAWLVIAASAAVPALSASAPAVHLLLIVGSGVLAVAVDSIGDRVLSEPGLFRGLGRNSFGRRLVTIDNVFRDCARAEAARLEAVGFGGIRSGSGSGFEFVTVFRSDDFVQIVREIRDQLVYAELGRLRDGQMPGWGATERRVDLRELAGTPKSIGAYDETIEGIETAVREVVDAILAIGLRHFEIGFPPLRASDTPAR